VLVVGDSHAQMLTDMFTTMAERHDLTLSLNVVGGCMWQENLRNTEQSPSGLDRCERARVGWYDAVLPALDPDLVILVGRERDDPSTWSDVIERRDGVEQPLDEMTLAATQETLAKISAVVPQTLVVESLVMPNRFEPDDCLASTNDAARCVVPVPVGMTRSDGYYLTAAAASPSISTVNLNPAFCPAAPLCQPVVDGQVVWRDDHHVTAAFASHREPEVWKLILATGVLADFGFDS
jgi:hypothetical protein